MLIALLLLVVLVVLIYRKSSQLGTSAKGPMAVAFGLWILFYAVTRGAVQVRADEMLAGLLMGLLIYAAAFVVIYFAMFAWLKVKSARWPEERVAPPPAVGAFKRFLGVHGKAIDWRYAISFFLGLTATQLVNLSFNPIIKVKQVCYVLGSNLLFVILLVLGFYFIDRLNVVWTALIIGVINGSTSVLMTLIYRLFPMTFLTSMLFTLVFIVSTIWLAKRLRQFWVALGLGYFLAGMVTLLPIAVYESVQRADSNAIKSILLDPKGYMVLALESLALVGVTLLFQMIFRLEVIRIPGEGTRHH